MAKKIKVLGAALVTVDGLCLAGDLGLDTDLDITMAMFSAVSSYVEDTMGEAADQVRLPSMDISRIKGKYTFLVVTSTGTSEKFLAYAKDVLKIIEGLYQNKLPDWDGQMIEGLEHDFERHVQDLKSWSGKEEKQEVPELGFGVLKKLSLLKYEGVEWEHEIDNYVSSLENAYNLYYLSGEHETAYELASKAAKLLEKRPDDKDSSLFYALAAKIRVTQRNDDAKELLKKARQKAEKQNNLIAMAEVANNIAICYVVENKIKKAFEWNQKAKNHMKGVKDLTTNARSYLYLINVKLTEVLAYAKSGHYNEAIREWTNLLTVIEKCPEGANEVEELTLAKHVININNNIGFFMTIDDRMNPQKYKKAIPYLEAGLKKIADSPTKATWYSLVLKNNLAQAYSFTGEFRKARILIEGVLRDSKELKSNYRIAAAERVYGVYYFLLGKKEGNKKYYYKALSLFEDALDKQDDKEEIENTEFFMKKAESELKKIF